MNLNDYTRIRKSIEGPVVPLNIPYDEDERIDYDAYERYVDRLAQAGVPLLILTYGSSEYGRLTDKEIYELTKIGANANADRAHFVGSTKCWSIKESLKYIEYAARAGARSVKIQPDYWTAGEATQQTVEYFVSIGQQSESPLWMYTVPQAKLSTQQCLEIVDRAPCYIAMKNDADGMYAYYDYIRSLLGKVRVVSGGQMKNMLFGWHFGSYAYLCPVAPFCPKISIQFIQALKDKQYEEAKRIIGAFEDPIMDLAKRYGWLPLIKTFLCIAGYFSTRRVRLPVGTLDDSAVKTVRAVYEKVYAPMM